MLHFLAQQVHLPITYSTRESDMVTLRHNVEQGRLTLHLRLVSMPRLGGPFFLFRLSFRIVPFSSLFSSSIFSATVLLVASSRLFV